MCRSSGGRSSVSSDLITSVMADGSLLTFSATGIAMRMAFASVMGMILASFADVDDSVS